MKHHSENDPKMPHHAKLNKEAVLKIKQLCWDLHVPHVV
jgi:hypothetical protein